MLEGEYIMGNGGGAMKRAAKHSGFAAGVFVVAGFTSGLRPDARNGVKEVA